MKYLNQVLILLLGTIYIQTIESSCVREGAILKLNCTSGTISSPGYPQNYNDSESQQVHIETNPGYVITLKFLAFDVEGLDETGSRTDFIRIVDGEVGRSNPYRSFLYGNLTTPFYLTSKTNRIRFRFTSNNNNVTGNGFTFDYQVHRVPPACDTTDEEDDNDKAEDFESCDDIERLDPSQCVGGCSANLSIAETSLITCRKPGSTFVPQTCVDPQVLDQCENSNYTNCPYSIEEILEIYKTLRLEIDSSSLTDEEFRDETRSVVGNPGRFITSNTCENLCQRHKKKNRYIKPRHCANFFTYEGREFCTNCRLFGCHAGGHLG